MVFFSVAFGVLFTIAMAGGSSKTWAGVAGLGTVAAFIFPAMATVELRLWARYRRHGGSYLATSTTPRDIAPFTTRFVGSGKPDESRLLVLELDHGIVVWQTAFATPTDVVDLADDTTVTIRANGAHVVSAEFRHGDKLLLVRARGRVAVP